MPICALKSGPWALEWGPNYHCAQLKDILRGHMGAKGPNCPLFMSSATPREKSWIRPCTDGHYQVHYLPASRSITMQEPDSRDKWFTKLDMIIFLIYPNLVPRENHYARWMALHANAIIRVEHYLWERDWIYPYLRLYRLQVKVSKNLGHDLPGASICLWTGTSQGGKVGPRGDKSSSVNQASKSKVRERPSITGTRLAG